MAQVTVTVNGRSYRMACDDGQEDHLSGLGERFDQAIDELRRSLGEIGDQRLIVMAGILMTDRLDEAERRLNRLEQETQGLKETRRDMLSRFENMEETFVATLDAASSHIERLAERLRPTIPDEDKPGSES